MEKPELEKVVEKLEKLDLREWKVVDNSFFSGLDFTVHVQGIIFQVTRYKKNDCKFYILNEEKSIAVEYHDQKKVINAFGEKLFKALEEYKHKNLPEQKKEFEERLNSFLSE